MSEAFFDEYEHFNFDQEKYLNSGHSGKQRTKKEASVHTNHYDPNGHNRKIVTKLQNTETNRRHRSSLSESRRGSSWTANLKMVIYSWSIETSLMLNSVELIIVYF